MSKMEQPGDWIRDIKMRLRALENMAPAGYTNVDRGTFEVSSPEGLHVTGTGGAYVDGLLQGKGQLNWTGPANLNGNTAIGGSLKVSALTDLGGATTISGATSITGDTDVTGRFKVTGPTELAGDTEITGSLEVKGDSEITGKLDVTGDTRLAGTLSLEDDLRVADGGRITVEGGTAMVIGRIAGRQAGIDFGDAQLTSTGREVVLENGTGNVGVSNVSVVMKKGRSRVLVSDGRVFVEGLRETTAAPNLYLSPDGELMRSTATPVRA